jgi:hypothetical protein
MTILQNCIITSIQKKGCMLRYIPVKFKTPKICLLAVQQNGSALQYVPEELITAEMCLIATKSGNSDIPKKFWTPELAIAYLQSNTIRIISIDSIPDTILIPELADIQQCGLMLKFIPDTLRTLEICMIAVKQNVDALQFVPKELRNHELYIIALKQKGSTLRFILEKNRNCVLCKIAVQQYGSALQYVPEKLRTPEICMIAVGKDGYALQYVPEIHITHEICMIAVKQEEYALRHVPEIHKTFELCMIAVKQNGSVLKYVPKIHKTFELCLIAISHIDDEHGEKILEFIPEKLRTHDICKAVVQNGGYDLEYVPEIHRTYEICMIAVKHDGTAIEYVPEIHRTYEICMIAVKHDGTALEYVPEIHRTIELCMVALQTSCEYGGDDVFQYVPDDLKTPKIFSEKAGTVESSTQTEDSVNWADYTSDELPEIFLCGDNSRVYRKYGISRGENCAPELFEIVYDEEIIYVKNSVVLYPNVKSCKMWNIDGRTIIDAKWFYLGYDVKVDIGFTSNGTINSIVIPCITIKGSVRMKDIMYSSIISGKKEDDSAKIQREKFEKMYKIIVDSKVQPKNDFIAPHIITLIIENAIRNKECCAVTHDLITKENACITTCAHIFSREGILQALVEKDTCPLCARKCYLI